jgi:hypothetical protein
VGIAWTSFLLSIVRRLLVWKRKLGMKSWLITIWMLDWIGQRYKIMKRHTNKTNAMAGIWSVRLTATGALIAGWISEERSWSVFLTTVEDAELLRGDTVMARCKGIL